MSKPQPITGDLRERIFPEEARIRLAKFLSVVQSACRAHDVTITGGVLESTFELNVMGLRSIDFDACLGGDKVSGVVGYTVYDGEHYRIVYANTAGVHSIDVYDDEDLTQWEIGAGDGESAS